MTKRSSARFAFPGCARWLRLVVVAAGAALVAACGGDKAPGAGDDSGGTAGPSKVASIEIAAASSSMPARIGESVDVTVIALDGSRRAVAGVPVTMQADSGVLSLSSTSTDDSGKLVAQFELGQDRSSRTVTIVATAGTTQAQTQIRVVGTTLTLNTNASVVSGPTATARLTAELKDAASAPISGAAVTFSTDQGSLSASTAVTDSAGIATVDISGITTTANIVARSGETVGGVTVRGSGSGEVTLQPQGIVLQDFTIQANPSVTGPNSPGSSGNFSTIEVRVTGLINNTSNVLVQNAPVKFRIAPNPSSPLFGQLEIDTEVNPVLSNVIGTATNRFIPFGATSGTDAITVCASVIGLDAPATPGISFPGNLCDANEKAVRLTIAQQALFVRISTDNQIEKTDGGLTYTKKFTVNVTDSAGRGVPGVAITPRLLPLGYRKGFYVLGDESWVKSADLGCENEDTNFNGVLDTTDANTNGDTFLWPGQVAAVSIANNGVTDGTGFVILSLKYGQRFGTWAEYQIEARASVGGSEGLAQFDYLLDVATADVKNKEAAPGFQFSPFGAATSCTDPN
jgi:hypothetical protein